MPQAPDHEIDSDWRELQARGINAVVEFFERDRERLRLFIMFRTDERILGRVDWDDVMQETFLLIQRRYPEFIAKPTVPFYVWMRALAGQVLIDQHRKHIGAQKRTIRREVSLHEQLPFQSTSTSLGSLLAASGLSPSGAAMQAEQLALLRDGMTELSEMDREVLILRHMEHMSNGEVAAALGIDKSAATKRYLRALKRIQERIESR